MRTIVAILGMALLAVVGWGLVSAARSDGAAATASESGPIPVEVEAVETGPIELRRTFSGTLVATSRFTVAPKVSGRIKRLAVDIADVVERDQLVAEIDDDEYQQAVRQAIAEHGVSLANRSAARAALEIAARALERVEALRRQGVASDTQLDVARTEHFARQAGEQVAEAQVTRAEAALEVSRIQLGYTRVNVSWSGGAERRAVAERFVDEGGTVAVGEPLLSVVELDPIRAVVFVTERDYGRLQPGLTAHVRTDAFPDREFVARVTRLAPVFRQESRQARVELVLENADHALKPGMFVRVEIVFERIENAMSVPNAALISRAGRQGIYIVSERAERGLVAAWRPVEVGIRQADRVQVVTDGIDGIDGRVVTIGQELLDDGSAVVIPDSAESAPAQGSP